MDINTPIMGACSFILLFLIITLVVVIFNTGNPILLIPLLMASVQFIITLSTFIELLENEL